MKQKARELAHLLPTEPSKIDPNDDPLFSSYRSVPWLARTHAVTLVPSIASLLTLRKLPPGDPSRQQLIGFGDPLFSKEEAADAAKDDASRDDRPLQVASNVTRGMPLKRRNAPNVEGVDSLQLAQLPRLPDTAAELKSIALALQSDPAKVLNLGKDANENNVKTMNLAKFKIIAFATHGLVPGELDGLTQTALALTAPDPEIAQLYCAAISTSSTTSPSVSSLANSVKTPAAACKPTNSSRRWPWSKPKPVPVAPKRPPKFVPSSTP